MNKKSSCFALFVFAVTVLAFSFIYTIGANAQPRLIRLSMGTGGTGGVYYIMGGGIANILTKYMPNTEVTVEVTGGSADNCKLLRAKKADLGICHTDVCTDAMEGVGKFGKGRPEDKTPMRALAALYTNLMQIVTDKDSPIKSVADMKGKRISTGSPGSGTEIKCERVLEAFGIDPIKDIKRERLGASESVNAFKDRKLDAFFWEGGLPTSAILDLASTPGISIKMLPCIEALPKMDKKYPGCYFPTVIPKGIYPGINYDVQTIGVTNIFVADEKLDDALAYNIVKTLYEHLRPDLVAVHKEAENITLQTMVAGVGIPFHPGARKFYIEKGVMK